MLGLKRFDFYGQAASIALSFFISFIPPVRVNFTGYFVVGTWQVISTIVHAIRKDHLLLSPKRRFYHYALLAVAGIGLLSMIIRDMMIWYLLGLLLFSPFMAVWYAAISYAELRVWKARAWVHLK